MGLEHTNRRPQDMAEGYSFLYQLFHPDPQDTRLRHLWVEDRHKGASVSLFHREGNTATIHTNGHQ